MKTNPTMAAERWDRLQELFHQALLCPQGDRDAFLESSCDGDTELREQIESLLAAHARTGVVPTTMEGALAFLNVTIGDRYGLEREVGAGGMATVYLAHDRKHEREVAVKVLRGAVTSAISTKRFLREIRVTANLQHPHILPLYDSGEADGFLFYVMPYVAGGSLRSALRNASLSIGDAIDIIVNVSEALHYAHGEGVVHRDIKPENILLLHGKALVADFGIAHATAVTDEGRWTDAGIPIGTPSYMSPEQASGDHDVDARTDVYALGCVLFECLTGRPPYIGSSIRKILSQHLTGPVPSMRDVRADLPADLDDIVQRALAKDPRDRFATVADLADAVAAAAGTGPSLRVRRAGGAAATPISSLADRQEIHFCSAADGVKIAYAEVGEGPSLVKVANWLSHLEHDWENPMWRHWWEGLARHHHLVRYDERGCGLSDWKADDMSFEAWVSDLEAVVDSAGLDRFALLGISQGGPIAIAYAVRHPERVTHLVLHGTYIRGRRHRDPTPELDHEREVQIELVRVGWGRETPAFRQVFTTLFYPDATPDETRWFTEHMRMSSSADNAARIMQGFDRIDVRDLAPRVTHPTLVLHCRGDQRVPYDEGRRVASAIPGALFHSVSSNNHIPLGDEPAWPDFLATIHGFLGVAG